MMDLLLAASGGESQSTSGGYVDDVFSAYTYTGNGSTQTITNGIDLAGKGGMVWIKDRTSIIDHIAFDTVRGATKGINPNLTDAQGNYTNALTAFTSSGFALGAPSTYVNTNGDNYVSWTFRKAPKFFDIVTYTGNGASNRTLSHQLNADVGMITVKATSTTGDWWVFHRSATGDLVLNTTAAQTASKANIPSATTSTFTVNGSANTNGVTYVAYLWAHDPSADGIIQCGSFTTDASGKATVNLGWEPQFSMVKAISTTSDWIMLDSMRGWNMSANDATLLANTSGAETVATERGNPTATGFDFKGGAASQTYIYLAIRRPNKPPTSGTQVYNAIARTGTGATATVTGVGFAPDLVQIQARTGDMALNPPFIDRLRGGLKFLVSTTNGSEQVLDVSAFGSTMDGMNLGRDNETNRSTATYINHFFRRAKGFFDVVCYTGTGSATTVPHGLGVAPELMIVKSRAGTDSWGVYSKDVGAGYYTDLNSVSEFTTSSNIWNSTVPTSAVFSVGTIGRVNGSGATYVAYLFASLPGISKVGSYTGNGTSQTINCGFSTGSRFILVKRTDATGDWYVWDSVRGIIAANDPHLSLNTTAAEVTTDDSVDPDASGFIVNQNTATNINVNGGKYIFLAIA